MSVGEEGGGLFYHLRPDTSGIYREGKCGEVVKQITSLDL